TPGPDNPDGCRLCQPPAALTPHHNHHPAARLRHWSIHWLVGVQLNCSCHHRLASSATAAVVMPAPNVKASLLEGHRDKRRVLAESERYLGIDAKPASGCPGTWSTSLVLAAWHIQEN